MTTLAVGDFNERCADVQWALSSNAGFSDLAALWMVSRVAAWWWCKRHCSERECEALAHNGRTHRVYTDFKDRHELGTRVGDRLALITLTREHGWSDARLARAIGVHPSAISEWLRRNAPDGVADALADYTEEAEAA
jgi:hypothetical protein